MKILITGGTGFIGTELTNYLISKNYIVHILSNNPSKVTESERLKAFYWNVKSKEIDSKAFDGVTCVINLAGKSINCVWNKANKAKILQSRIDASQTLFNFLSKNQHQVKQIVNASAIGIYKSSLTKIYKEDSVDYNPEFLGEVCVEWEKNNQKFSELGIKTSFVRIGLVLDKTRGALTEFTRLVKFGVGKKMGSGNQIYSWIHIHDLVRMIHFILQENLEGVFNAVSSHPVTQQQLNITLANHFNKSFILTKLPEWLFKVALSERSALILDSQNVSNSKIISNSFLFKYDKIKNAIESLY